MTHPKDDRPDPLKPTPVTNKPDDTRIPGGAEAGQRGVTGKQPGMPDGGPNSEPDMGPGRGRKDLPGVDPSGTIADRTRTGSDDSADHDGRSNEDQRTSSSTEDRRDQGSDKEEDVKGHRVGDVQPRHRNRAND